MSDLPGLVLLYDGLCGLCNGFVRFILARDRGGSLRFAALQSDFAKAILARHPEIGDIDTVAVVEFASVDQQERVHARSDAVLRLAQYLGGPWGALMALRILPRVVRDWGYDAIARVRYRVFGKYESCPLPGALERARFIL